MDAIERMSAEEYSGALYGALSKRQVTTEARKRGWAGDDARTGKSALCIWLAEHVPASERAALLNAAMPEQPAPLVMTPQGPMPAEQPAEQRAEDRKTSVALVAAEEAHYMAPNNTDAVAKAIAAALGTLQIKPSMDADAVRALVRAEIADAMQNVRPIEVHIGEREAVRIDERVHPLFDKVLRLTQAGVNVLLVGPAGCGKSYLAKQVAKALGNTYGTLHCSAGVSEAQVTGWLLPVGEGGAFKFQPSHFATLYTEGNSVFLIDEIDAADANMLTVLNGALANGALHIPQCVERPEWKRGYNVHILAAANTFGQGADTVYVGRNQLDAATIDRFYVVTMDYDVALEADILRACSAKDAAVFARWVDTMRERVKQNRLRRVVSTRTLQKGLAALDAGVELSEVKADLLAGWTRDELNKVGE